MYFYCHASTLPLCYENNENWPKNYKYFKELPFLTTNFVRSDVITNSPKMLTKQKKRGKFKFPQSPWILVYYLQDQTPKVLVIVVAIFIFLSLLF